ncbi:OB-fold protein [Legionella feeleii]|uniref:tRNA-anti-like protein n=1 Tax=Legionella feeleii TaxID=453 RepID=A0A0W0U8P4_9GAMM|nr:hypothetical protein [Legionella feeleii]KTD04170.1 tRNA-anti-like protein [Legionella feeleii]SPX60718.1 tRNA_anti-like [Legionella feeleii]
MNKAINLVFKKTKILQYAAVILASILVISIFTNTRDIKKPNKSTASKGYIMSNKELAILNIIFKEDIEAFSKGDAALLKDELISASVKQIAQDYNNNQVAADQQYYKKLLFISGEVQSINSGLGNTPYLSLYGVNPFLLPQAHFQKGNTPKIATLKKEQKIYLVCKGQGATIGTPIFSDCQFASDYAQKRVVEIKSMITSLLKGDEPKSTLTVYSPIPLIALARMLPDTSACFTTADEKKCLNEIHVISNKKINGKDLMKQQIIEVSSELKTRGINVEKFKHS